MSNNPDSDLLLYAKHHYERESLWDDLAKIIAKRNYLEAYYLSKSIIFENIIHITMKYVDMDGPRMVDFLFDIQPQNWWKWSDKRVIYSSIEGYDFYEATVKKCLNFLAVTTVYENGKELIHIDDPDPELFPISKTSRYHVNNKKD